MKRTKRFLTMALACVMMMGAVLAFAPKQEASAMVYTIYVPCSNPHCSVYGGGDAPHDWCSSCQKYHCRYCGL